MEKKFLTLSLLFIFANPVKSAEQPELSSLRPGPDNVLSITDFVNGVTEALNAERIAERIEAERIAEIMETERIAAEIIAAERIGKQS
jgi:hypothetical protein